MDEELDQLAARYRKAAVDARAQHEEGASARAARLEAGRAAREALLAELAELAEAIGVVESGWEGDALVWRYGDRTVRFEPRGLGDRVAVAWRELVPREGELVRQPELRDRWVLAIAGPQADRLPWRQQGLVRLLEQGLRLPSPEDPPAGQAASPPASAPEPSPPTGEERRRRL